MQFKKIDNRAVRSIDANFSLRFEGRTNLIYEENGKRLILYTDAGIEKKGFFRTIVTTSVALYAYDYVWEGCNEQVTDAEKKLIAENISSALYFLNIKHVIE